MLYWNFFPLSYYKLLDFRNYNEYIECIIDKIDKLFLTYQLFKYCELEDSDINNILSKYGNY